MNFFKRLFKIGQAEANSAVDKMEDPIKMTEQGIRDMKEELAKSLEALAEVKATTIRAHKDYESYLAKAEEYQTKALLLLKKAQQGEMEMAEAENLATQSLVKKEQQTEHAEGAKTEHTKLSQSVSNLEGNISELRSTIEKWENELKTLKARVKVSSATKKINKEMARIDQDSTVEMLERMKEKVAQEEAMAEAYGDIAEKGKSIDKKIDKAIDTQKESAKTELEKLKDQLGMTENE
ncbi:MAG: PspA/IM30 family protein [Flavobacteriales bacterium]|jgi:phage shock protein A|nr:PspA/IM30 family protein [Flavobacteriales bacterium]